MKPGNAKPRAFKLRRTIALPVISSFAVYAFYPLAAYPQGLPTGARVTAGKATVSAPATGALQINQSSQRAVIKWSDFSIAQGNRVTFVQPNANAAALNIVTGNTASVLAGTLTANGTVFLVNPSGIAITPTGLVDTRGGFIASTLGISDKDFMAGRYLFSGNGGSVVNSGQITTGPGGAVVLLGGTASNEGLITANLGRVALGAGAAATLDLSGDGFLQVMLPSNAVTASGQALVTNSGVIAANGGTVTLQAATVRQAVRDAVYMPGEISARSVSGHNGAIVLDGGSGGTVNVTGSLKVDGDVNGGRIDITGNTVALAGATLSATGSELGGVVRVGGAFQGGRVQDPASAQVMLYAGRFGTLPTLANALTTSIDGNSSIDVSATGSSGTGGTAIVWSDSATVMQGAIAARGAASGGAVEISSKSTVQSVALNRVSLGAGGSLLLDPQDILIDSAGTDTAGNVNFADNAGGVTHLKDADITALLSSGASVTLQASEDINWNNNFTFVTRTPSTPGGDLTLSAGRSVTLSGVFTTADGNWTITANDTAAHGVVDSERGAGLATIDLGSAQFINSNGRLTATLADGAGNTNHDADGIRLGAFNGNSVIAAIAPTASTGIAGVNTRLLLTADITVAGAISLTGNLQEANDNSALTTLSGQTVTWTNEKTGGTIRGEGALKFVENGVTTRFGLLGAPDSVRLTLGDGSAPALTRVYGDADPTLADVGTGQLSVAAYSALQPANALDAILAAGSLSVGGPGVAANAGSSSLTISATSAIAMAPGARGYFIDLTPGTVPLIITQRPLTPTVSNGNYTYGSPAAVATLNGVVNNDPIAPVATLNSTANVTMAANGAGFGFDPTVPAGSSSFSLSGITGTGASNYKLDLSGVIAGSLAIAKKPLNYFAFDGGQTYGTLGTLPVGGFTGGVVGTDDVTPVVGLSQAGTPAALAARLAAGTYATDVVSLAGTSAGNYTIAPTGNTSGSFVVAPKPITYAVADANSIYGTLAIPGASTLSGVLPGDVVTGTTGVAAAGNPVTLTATTPAGNYDEVVTALGGAANSNYVVAASGNQNGVLRIDPKTLTYTGGSIAQTYGLMTLPSPPLDGVVGGDVVSAAQSVTVLNSNSAGGSGAFPVGNYLIGLFPNSLSGAQAANYVLATSGNTPNTVAITPKPLTFQVNAASGIYGTLVTLPGASLGPGVVAGDDVVPVTTVSKAGGDITLTPTTAAGSYALGAALGGQAAGNYMVAVSGNTAGALTIAPKTITWQVADGNMIYGDTPTNAVTLNALVPGDSVISNVSALDGGGVAIVRPGVGNYPAGVTSLSGPLAGNYALAASGNTTGLLTVDPRVLTYSVAAASSVYGTLAVTGVATLNNIVPGDTVGATVDVRQGVTPVTLTARSAAGSYVEQVTALGNSNYVIAPTGNSDGTLTIAPKPVTFVTADASSTYGTAAVLAPGTLSGVLGGDSVAGITTLATGVVPGVQQAVGSYPLIVGSLNGTDAANYAVTTTGSTLGTLGIAPKTLTYALTVFWNNSATGSSRTYGDLFQYGGFGDFGQSGGGALSALTGVVGNDAVSQVVNAPVVPVSSSGAYRVGTYQWTGGALTGAAASNYVLASSGNTDVALTITPKAVPVTLSAQSNSSFFGPVYGGTASYAAIGSVEQSGRIGTGQGQDQVTAVAAFSLPQGIVQALPDRLAVGNYAVVLSGLSGPDAANYVGVAQGGSFSVAPKPVTVQVGSIGSTYGTLAVPGAGTTISGLLAGDTVAPALTVTPNNFATPVTLAVKTPAGLYRINATALNGADAGNYTLIPFDASPIIASSAGLPVTTTGLLNIARLTLGYTVDPATLSQTYGTLISAPTQLNGVLAGDTVAVTPQAQPVSVVTGSRTTVAINGTLLDAGTYTYLAPLSGADAGNYQLPASSFGTISIAQKPLTATIPDRTTTYGTLLAAAPTLTGVVAGQTITPVVTTSNSSGTAITYTAQTDAGTYSDRVSALSGSTALDYIINAATSTTGKLVIDPKTLTLTALPAATSIYGSSATLGTLSGVLFGDDVGVQTNAAGAIQAVRLSDDGSGGLLYTPKLNAGSYSYSFSTALTGARSTNYRVASGASGTLTVAQKTLLYLVDNAEGQYGNFQACDDSSCYPWTPGIALGASHLSGVLSGDTVNGTVGLIDLNGVSGTISSTTPVGKYFEVVTGLTGASASNYKIAPTGSVPGVLSITPVWLSYTTSSAVYLPGAGLVGVPGIPNIRSGGTANPLNGDVVQAVVVADAPNGSVGIDLGALQVGRYYFTVDALSGKDAGNYRIIPPGMAFKAGAFSTDDVGTLDVFANSSLGLGLATTQAQIPKIPPYTPPVPQAVVTAPSLNGKDGVATGDSTSFGRNITLTGTASTVKVTSDSAGASTTASGAVTTGISAGPATLSAQASGVASALATAGITGVDLKADASGHVDVTLQVGPGYIMYGAQADAGASGTLGVTGVNLSAQTTAGVYEQAGAGGSLGGGVTGTADATAGVFAFADASAAAGYINGKIQTKADGSVGVGGSAGTHGGISGSTGSLDAGVTVYTPGSLGGTFAWTGGYSNGALTVGLDLGAKLGIGGLDLSINFTIDPNQAANAIATSGFGQFVAGLAGMTGGTSVPAYSYPPDGLDKASSMANDPAARFAFLSANPGWKNYSSNSSDSTPALTASYNANLKFFNDYQALVTNTANVLATQLSTQATFLNLLKTDPNAAIAYAHSGAINNAAITQTQLAYSASSLGLKLSVVNGKPAYVDK